MEKKEKTKALILETEPEIAESIEKILRRRSYAVTIATGKETALNRLMETFYPLAVVGNPGDDISTFEAMRKVVTTSPMTSLILISDLDEAEVHEKSEGYGILGHVTREIPSKDLLALVKTFENIFAPMNPAVA